MVTRRRNHPGRDALRRNRICYWCSTVIEGSERSIDHYIPLARGGYDHSSNMVVCCRGCNRAKGSLLPWEFRPDVPVDRDRAAVRLWLLGPLNEKPPAMAELPTGSFGVA
jgi:5-methylcytosine-specific restriction endonuclease McrA